MTKVSIFLHKSKLRLSHLARMACQSNGLSLWRDSCWYYFNRYNELRIMAEQKSDSTQPTQVEVVNTSRRRLTTAALAGPVVLGTLASKQVLASGIAYQCTISGQVSGTSSPRPGENTSCVLGVSPGCWKNQQTSCYHPSGTKQTPCTPRYPSPYTPDTPFSTVFGSNPCGTGTATTLWQMLGSGGNAPCNDTDTKFARVCTASLLSAKKWYNPSSATSYPLSSDQVIGLYKIGAGLAGALLFSELFSGVSTGTVWSQAQIQSYLESLYGGNELNDCPSGGNTP